MITCPNPSCRTENPDEAAFCSKCKSYLRWDDRLAGPETPRGSISIQLAADALSVTPGTEGGCDVWVRNGASAPVEVVLDLYESAAAWSSVEPASLVVPGGGQARAHIRLLPPAPGSAVEGPHRLGVRASQRGDAADSVAAEAVVAVTGVVDFSLSIDPTKSKAYRAATHRVLVENTGNAPVSAQVSASEASGELGFDLEHESLAVAVGTTAETTLTANVRRPKRFGRAVERPFDVAAADPRVTTRHAEGTVTTTPSVPISLVALCAVVLGIGMAAVGVATVALDDDDDDEDPSPTSTLGLAAETTTTGTVSPPFTVITAFPPFTIGPAITAFPPFEFELESPFRSPVTIPPFDRVAPPNAIAPTTIGP